MDTSRDDVAIVIRSAFLQKGSQQRFSLFALSMLSILLIFLETLDINFLNKARSLIKDSVYRSAVVASYPISVFNQSFDFLEKHINLHNNYNLLVKDNYELKSYI